MCSSLFKKTIKIIDNRQTCGALFYPNIPSLETFCSYGTKKIISIEKIYLGPRFKL